MNQSESVLIPVRDTSALSGAARSIEERNTRSRTRFGPGELPALSPREEVLVVDERCELRPSQVIERKLTSLLRNSALPIRFLLTGGLQRTR